MTIKQIFPGETTYEIVYELRKLQVELDHIHFSDHMGMALIIDKILSYIYKIEELKAFHREKLSLYIENSQDKMFIVNQLKYNYFLERFLKRMYKKSSKFPLAGFRISCDNFEYPFFIQLCIAVMQKNMSKLEIDEFLSRFNNNPKGLFNFYDAFVQLFNFKIKHDVDTSFFENVEYFILEHTPFMHLNYKRDEYFSYHCLISKISAQKVLNDLIKFILEKRKLIGDPEIIKEDFQKRKEQFFNIVYKKLTGEEIKIVKKLDSIIFENPSLKDLISSSGKSENQDEQKLLKDYDTLITEMKLICKKLQKEDELLDICKIQITGYKSLKKYLLSINT